MLLSAKLRRYGKHYAPAYAWAREAAETLQALKTLRDERDKLLQEVEAEKGRLQRYADDLDAKATKRMLALGRRAALLDARERKVALAERELARPDDAWKMPAPPPVTRYATPSDVTPGANTPYVRAPAPPAVSRVHCSSRTKPFA